MMEPLPQGTSEPYDVALFDDGVALVGTGLNVDLVIRTRTGETVQSTIASWEAATAYVFGDVVQPETANDHYYVCVTVDGGVSGATEPTFPISAGDTVVDDGVTWQEVALAVAWLSQADGTVRITGAEILEHGEWAVRFKLTDTGGKIGYVPNKDQWETWEVVKVVP